MLKVKTKMFTEEALGLFTTIKEAYREWLKENPEVKVVNAEYTVDPKYRMPGINKRSVIFRYTDGELMPDPGDPGGFVPGSFEGLSHEEIDEQLEE